MRGNVGSGLKLFNVVDVREGCMEVVKCCNDGFDIIFIVKVRVFRYNGVEGSGESYVIMGNGVMIKVLVNGNGFCFMY